MRHELIVAKEAGHGTASTVENESWVRRAYFRGPCEKKTGWEIGGRESGDKSGEELEIQGG